MQFKGSRNTVRRSVALPAELVEEVRALAPPELQGNLNRLVTVALQEFAANQRKRSFEEDMARMAADPGIRSECDAISRDFAAAEADGLAHD